MISDCVISQSVLVNGQPYQQLSNLSLDGLSTKKESFNTDNSGLNRGRLYGSFTKSGATYTLHLYKDILKTELVATASASALGMATISEANDSGLSGRVNIAQYNADDTSIEVVCFIANDKDIEKNNLEGVKDYDPSTGFAEFHITAFNYFKEFVVSRYKSIIFNPKLIDTRSINGGLGGYDLSRVLNWSALTEAAAHYALARIADRQFIERGSFWEKCKIDSNNIVKAHLSNVELTFDTNQDRVEDKSRSFSTWKISRA